MISRIRDLKPNLFFLLEKTRSILLSYITYLLSKGIDLYKFMEKSLKYELIDLDKLSIIISSLLNEYNMKYNVLAYDIIEENQIIDVVKTYIVKKNNELYYVVEEPSLNFSEISDIIAVLLKYGDNCNDPECLVNVVENYLPNKLDLFIENIQAILYHYEKLKSGYGPLYPIILDEQIEEASGSQKDGIVYVIHRKYVWYGWIKTNIKISQTGMDSLVLSLARKARKTLSLSSPLTEGLTDEGVRIAVTFSNEVSRHGTSFVIRKKPWKPWTITRVINDGMLSPLLAAYLWLILEMRGSILIVGGIGTGKTTLLQALLTLIPPSRRVVTIEDTPEISSTTGLWDPLVVRYSYSNETSIDEYKLLKFALRRRADYIVVGEVRGKEARLLVQASRLGHGVVATFHADDSYTAIERLIAPPISIPRTLLSSIWVIVTMDPSGTSNKRRVKEIHELSWDAKKLYSIAKYNYKQQLFIPSTANELIDNSVRLKHLLEKDVLIQELQSKTLFLSRLTEQGIFDLDELARNIQKYYSLEDEVLEKAKEST